MIHTLAAERRANAPVCPAMSRVSLADIVLRVFHILRKRSKLDPSSECTHANPESIRYPETQDPTLNLMFDRAFDEFRDSTPTRPGGEDGAGEAAEENCSRMIGVVSRLGGGKRALAVGLGSGGPAGECRSSTFGSCVMLP